MLTITHIPAEGTLIDGTARGDGTTGILKAAGWRWSRTLGSWYVPRSRDTTPPTAVIEWTAEQLRTAGHDVTATIDDSRRPACEADRIMREQQRVEHLTARAERIAAAADTADQHAHDLGARIPFGQPILVGHHSEGRLRRHYDQVDRAQRTAVELGRAADEAAAAADTAGHATSARHNSVTVANRIQRLSAEIGVITRNLERVAGTAQADAYRARTADRLAELTGQLAYWEQIRADQIAGGTAVDHGPDTIAVGDLVQGGSPGWHPVVKINRKTVAVPSGHSWTTKVEYHRITGHRATVSGSPAAGES